MTPNPTPSTPQPPPGFRIIPPEWQPIDTAPKDGRPIWARGRNFGKKDGNFHALFAWHDGEEWKAAGTEDSTLLHLTDWLRTEPLDCFKPTPDFRALCEELKAGLEAAIRLRQNKYIAWAYAGGVDDCEHGRGNGIACRKCDETKVYDAYDRANAALKGEK